MKKELARVKYFNQPETRQLHLKDHRWSYLPPQAERKYMQILVATSKLVKNINIAYIRYILQRY